MDRNVLMMRFGGIGDIVSLTAVGKILNMKGYNVTFCVPEKQVELLDNLPFFHEIKGIRRLPDIMKGVDCIQNELGWISLEKVKQDLHKKDWLIAEFKNLVENNSLWGAYPYNKEHSYWCKTMNSNFQNWVDIALNWVKIDHTQIEDNLKRPEYIPEEFELDNARGLIGNNDFIAVNLTSSSLARTVEHQYKLVKELVKRGYKVLSWHRDGWLYQDKEYKKQIRPKSVRESAALIKLSKLFISADSGLSHIAEAMCVKQIILYTTVPPWTRMKYYKYATAIEADVPCHPCFVIGRYCPLIEFEVAKDKKGLTPREKKMLKLHEDKVPMEEAAQKMNLSVDGLNQFFDATIKKFESLKNALPECVKSITVEKILEEVEKQYGEI